MSRTKLGCDLGRVIVGPKQAGDKPFDRPPMPDCFHVFKKIICLLSPENVFIVSRVNSEQKERAEKWLEDHNFYIETGFWKENLYFCFERRDKAMFAAGLGLDYFIDDRPDCLLPMVNTNKLLFNPYSGDLEKYKDKLNEFFIVNNWLEVKTFFNL